MAITSVFGKKVAALALAALTLGAGVTISAGQAEARNGRNAAIAAGVIGALVGGAVIASAANAHGNRHHYEDAYEEAPVYHAPQAQQVFHHGGPMYFQGGGRFVDPHGHHGGYRHHRGYSHGGHSYGAPTCFVRNKRVWTPYGWEFRRVQICR